MLTIVASLTALIALWMFVRNVMIKESPTYKINWVIWSCDQAYLILVLVTILALLNALGGKP
jgi:predicted lysophospholipase L1 biosynthesis ABC-type transport system permease subunit